MKLFMLLALAAISTPAPAEPQGKIERKLASINLDSSSVMAALSKNDFLKNSQDKVNELTKATSYKCGEAIQNSELKDINVVSEKKEIKIFKFSATRLCFDQSGPGVVEVHYEGFLRQIAGQLQVTDVTVKLVQNGTE